MRTHTHTQGQQLSQRKTNKNKGAQSNSKCDFSQASELYLTVFCILLARNAWQNNKPNNNKNNSNNNNNEGACQFDTS